MADPRDALDAIGQLPDTEIDLAGAALQFGRIGAPDANWEHAAAELSVLARDAVALNAYVAATSPLARAGALAALLGRHGFAGDTESYDDLANANLVRVIERRRGLPVALGILWLHCARAVGWPAHGVDFPGHFLVAIEGDPPARDGRRPSPRQVVVDVFAGGVVLQQADLLALLQRVSGPLAELRPGLLAPMSARSVLMRLQQNVKVRLLAQERTEDALGCTEDMLRVAPDAAPLWREAGVLNQRLGHFSRALQCHRRVLALVPDGDLADMSRRAIAELEARLS